MSSTRFRLIFAFFRRLSGEQNNGGSQFGADLDPLIAYVYKILMKLMGQLLPLLVSTEKSD